jgi:hypothetical protein
MAQYAAPDHSAEPIPIPESTAPCVFLTINHAVVCSLTDNDPIPKARVGKCQTGHPGGNNVWRVSFLSLLSYHYISQ